MIVIRTEQMSVFEDAARSDLSQRLADHLIQVAAGDAPRISRHELLRRSVFGIEAARRCAITESSAVAAFVGLMFSIGPGFFEQDTIRRLLGATGLSQTDRIRSISDQATAADWLDAAEGGASSNWPEETGSSDGNRA